MPRDGYTNYPPSDQRLDLFAAIAHHTRRDQDHASRVEMLDEALRHYAAFLENRRDAALLGALEQFIASDQFVEAITSSTKARRSGENYSVELFEDGSYRVLWSGEIGNLYQSPGMILVIPGLSEDDIDGDLDAAAEFYADDVAEALRAKAAM
jgi:hypothetical protein